MKRCCICGAQVDDDDIYCKCGNQLKPIPPLDLDEKEVAKIKKKKDLQVKIAFASGIIFFFAFAMTGLRVIWEPARATRFREMVAYAFNVWWAIAIVSCIVGANCGASALSKVKGNQLLSGKTLGLARASKIMSIISVALCIFWFFFICFLGFIWVWDEMFQMWRPSALASLQEGIYQLTAFL